MAKRKIPTPKEKTLQQKKNPTAKEIACPSSQTFFCCGKLKNKWGHLEFSFTCHHINQWIHRTKVLSNVQESCDSSTGTLGSDSPGNTICIVPFLWKEIWFSWLFGNLVQKKDVKLWGRVDVSLSLIIFFSPLSFSSLFLKVAAISDKIVDTFTSSTPSYFNIISLPSFSLRTCPLPQMCCDSLNF